MKNDVKRKMALPIRERYALKSPREDKGGEFLLGASDFDGMGEA